MFVNSGIIVYLFFGGWYMPIGIYDPAIWFLIKLHIFVIIMILIRAALPRVRIDQFLNIGWTRLIPMAVINLFLAIGIGYLHYDMKVDFFELAVVNVIVVAILFVLVIVFGKEKQSVSLVDPVGGAQ